MYAASSSEFGIRASNREAVQRLIVCYEYMRRIGGMAAAEWKNTNVLRIFISCCSSLEKSLRSKSFLKPEKGEFKPGHLWAAAQVGVKAVPYCVLL